MRSAKFTRQQLAALEALKAAGRELSCDELAELLETSPEGAAATASSLVRRRDASGERIVSKIKVAGRVRYVFTGARA